MSDSKNNWLITIAFINIYIIWGTTFLAISYGLTGFPPFILSAFRFLIAGTILLSWSMTQGERPTSWLNWKKNAIAGILILTGGTGLVAWGQQYISATEAAITIATGPFWFIVIDKKNWGNYFSDKFIPIGLLIGFLGLVLFLNGSVGSAANEIASGGMRIAAFAVLALSSISWVLGSLYSKNNPSSHSTFMNISQQMIVAGIAAVFIGFFKGEWAQFSIVFVPIQAWLGLFFMIFFGSIVAYLSYIWLLSVRPAAMVSTYTYINPIVAFVVGWIFTGQTITGLQFSGLIIILAGVFLTNAKSYLKISNRTKVKIRRAKRAFVEIKNLPYRLIFNYLKKV